MEIIWLVHLKFKKRKSCLCRANLKCYLGTSTTVLKIFLKVFGLWLCVKINSLFLGFNLLFLNFHMLPNKNVHIPVLSEVLLSIPYEGALWHGFTDWSKNWYTSIHNKVSWCNRVPTEGPLFCIKWSHFGILFTSYSNEPVLELLSHRVTLTLNRILIICTENRKWHTGSHSSQEFPESHRLQARSPLHTWQLF